MDERHEPADELIARARRVYAECSSYADEGTQISRFERVAAGGPHLHTTQRRFRTRWKRPSAFLFEYVSPPHFQTWDAPESSWERYVIWTSPTGPRQWWTTDPELEEPKTLDLAIAGATGVSGGTAFNIPTLLRVIEQPAHWFPSVAGFRGEVMDLEGRRCLAIAMRRDTMEQRLWLEVSTGLVLRLDEKNEFTAEGQRAASLRSVERLRSGMAQDPANALQYESLLRTMEQDAEEQARKLRDPFTLFSTTVYRPRLDPELRGEDFVFEPPSGS